MGGYNTYCEILSFDKPALIVPRVQPREEQLIRARRAAELGLIEMLLPEEADDRAALRRRAARRCRTVPRPSQSNPRSAARRARRIFPRSSADLARPARRPTISRSVDGIDAELAGQPQDRRRPEGLSAPVGNLHRAGNAGPGAAPGSTWCWSRCGGRPTRSAIRCMTRSRRRCVYLPEYLHEEPLRVVRAAVCWLCCGRASGARSRRFAADLRRDLTPQPRPPLRPGARAGAPNGRKARAGCTRISSTRRHR